jgi:hypothetical protein
LKLEAAGLNVILQAAMAGRMNNASLRTWKRRSFDVKDEQLLVVSSPVSMQVLRKSLDDGCSGTGRKLWLVLSQPGRGATLGGLIW